VFETPTESPVVEGCSCACDEFKKIQEQAEHIEKASQAEQMAILGDPAYMQLITCMGACAMKYAGCVQ
jgi:hypothetical protein